MASRPVPTLSWWSILGTLALPWEALFLVWAWGLHVAVLVIGIAFAAAVAIAAGIAIDREFGRG